MRLEGTQPDLVSLFLSKSFEDQVEHAERLRRS
jgi:hypothetical protein